MLQSLLAKLTCDNLVIVLLDCCRENSLESRDILIKKHGWYRARSGRGQNQQCKGRASFCRHATALGMIAAACHPAFSEKSVGGIRI